MSSYLQEKIKRKKKKSRPLLKYKIEYLPVLLQYFI